MKELRRTIRRILLEQDDYLEKLNGMYASPDPESHIQADALVDALYGDNPPEGLRRYGVYDAYLGDTEETGLTKEEARTWWHRNEDWYPANADGYPSDVPEYDPDTRQYAYITRSFMKFSRR